jgi:hypothetical protein
MLARGAVLAAGVHGLFLSMPAGFGYLHPIAMKVITFVVSLALSVICHADGLPKNEKGELTVKHTLIDLNPSQVEEMEVLNSVTLTKEQWAEVRKVSPNTPKRLQGIIPITWNDCLCEERCEAVRMLDGKLAVFLDDQTVQTIHHHIYPGRPLNLQVDRRGQFHLDGILVRYHILIDAIRASEAVGPEHRQDPMGGTAEVKAPPGMSLDDPVFEERITSVYVELAAKGWNGGKLPYWLSEKMEKARKKSD